MSYAAEKIMENAMKDPGMVYHHQPREVVNDNRLTVEERLRILESWEQDLKALIRAEGENMAASAEIKSADPGEMLREIHKAEKTLKPR